MYYLIINPSSDTALSLVYTLKSKINIFFGQNKCQGPKYTWPNQVGGTFGLSWSCWALLPCVWDHSQIVEAQLGQSSVGKQSDKINPPESGLSRSVNIWSYLLQTVNTAKRERHICPLAFNCLCDYFLSVANPAHTLGTTTSPR